MITIECEQGTQEWLDARCGIPTASCFDQILTPKTRKPSASQRRYLHRLCAEWILGHSISEESAGTIWTERGKQLEDDAARWYELQNDIDVERIGFCVLERAIAGCSPDRLVGSDGLLEVKNPSAQVHVGYFLDGVEDLFSLQIQGQLWITGRTWCDLVVWNPIIPPIVHRFTRDEELIELLSSEVQDFHNRLVACREALSGTREIIQQRRREIEERDVPVELSS